MVNNLMLILFSAIFFLGEQKNVFAQSANPYCKIESFSCQLDSINGLVFKGKLTLENGIKLPQNMIFAPQYDTIIKLFSGNYELEMLHDECFKSIKNTSFYNNPPLDEYTRLDDYSRERFFAGRINSNRFRKKGFYRIRIRFYFSHFCDNCVDLFSEWCYVTVD